MKNCLDQLLFQVNFWSKNFKEMDDPNLNDRPEIQLMTAIKTLRSLREIEEILTTAPSDDRNFNFNLCPNILHQVILEYLEHDYMLEVLQLLLDTNFPVNSKNEQGQTPLIFALTKKYESQKVEEIADLLFSYGADPDDSDNLGQTALHHVIHGKRATGDYWNWPSHGLQLAKWCIETGADINSQKNDSQTPLHVACNQLDELMIEFFLDFGAEVNIRDQNSNTPLHILARHNNPEVCRMLLLKGAFINSKNFRGRTPLHLAVERNNDKVVKFLLEHGADINVVDNEGNTPASWKSPQGFTFSIAITVWFWFYFREREAAGLILIPENREVMKRLENQLISHDPERRYYDKKDTLLKDVLQKMKSHYIDPSTTIYDILKKSDSAVMNYVENDYLIEKVFSWGKYPCYAVHIKAKFCRAALRKVLIDSLSNYFSCFAELNFPLPCIEKIFEQLTIEEISDLLRIDGIRNISAIVETKLIKWFRLEPV